VSTRSRQRREEFTSNLLLDAGLLRGKRHPAAVLVNERISEANLEQVISSRASNDVFAGNYPCVALYSHTIYRKFLNVIARTVEAAEDFSARAQLAFDARIGEVGGEDAVESRAVFADEGLQPTVLNLAQSLFSMGIGRAGRVGCTV